MKATAILISGCQDNQLSMDGTFNGAFTGVLKSKWNGGAFKGDYRSFHATILGAMPEDQSPNYYMVGPIDTAFEQQKPFTI